jgi:hypothetical protein
VNAAIRIASGSPRVLEQNAEITIFDLAKDKPSRALRHGR